MVQSHGRRTKIAYLENMMKTDFDMAKHGIARECRRPQLRVEIRRFLPHLCDAVLGHRCTIALHNMLSMGLNSLLARERQWRCHVASSTRPNTPPAATRSFSSSNCQRTARSRVGT